MSQQTSIATPKARTVVDLFCGAGGLTHGFYLEGFNVLAGIDSDSACKFAYEANNGEAQFIHKNILDVNAAELNLLYPSSALKILVGCAPCQPFSQYTKKRQGKDSKWQLLEKFSELVEGVKPVIVSMENVPDLIKYDKGRVYTSFVNDLENCGYWVSSSNIYCASYGVPQKRTRLVLLGSLIGPISMIPGTLAEDDYVTVQQSIGNLPKLAAGDVCPIDPLHRAAGLSEINLKRIKQSVQGGTWRDWETSLVADCHKRQSGQSYDCVYGRMRWDEPAPTITTQCDGFGNGRFGHPEQDRAISMREAALLQSFPLTYKFLEPNKKWHIQTLARLIGNAVPVLLARAVARSVKKHLDDNGR